VTWPLFVWSDARWREAECLSLLSRVLRDAITDRLRQTLGKTYAPNIGLETPRSGDQGAMNVQVATTPKDAGLVREEILRIAADLASKGVDEAALGRARAPWLASLAAQRTYNGWWLNLLSGSVRDPARLIMSRNDVARIASLSRAEVDAAARRWLAPGPYVVTVLPEDQAARPSAPPTAAAQTAAPGRR
jgi:zinc protease